MFVTNGNWRVSYEGYHPCKLNVYKVINKPNPKTGWNITFKYGDQNGRLFDSIESARQFAYEHGYTQIYYK
jgi:hypothetical protein